MYNSSSSNAEAASLRHHLSMPMLSTGTANVGNLQQQQTAQTNQTWNQPTGTTMNHHQAKLSAASLLLQQQGLPSQSAALNSASALASACAPGRGSSSHLNESTLDRMVSSGSMLPAGNKNFAGQQQQPQSMSSAQKLAIMAAERVKRKSSSTGSSGASSSLSNNNNNPLSVAGVTQLHSSSSAHALHQLAGSQPNLLTVVHNLSQSHLANAPAFSGMGSQQNLANANMLQQQQQRANTNQSLMNNSLSSQSQLANAQSTMNMNSNSASSGGQTLLQQLTAQHNAAKVRLLQAGGQMPKAMGNTQVSSSSQIANAQLAAAGGPSMRPFTRHASTGQIEAGRRSSTTRTTTVNTANIRRSLLLPNTKRSLPSPSGASTTSSLNRSGSRSMITHRLAADVTSTNMTNHRTTPPPPLQQQQQQQQREELPNLEEDLEPMPFLNLNRSVSEQHNPLDVFGGAQQQQSKDAATAPSSDIRMQAAMDTDSLLHNSCKLYPATFSVVESALRFDPLAVRRCIPIVCSAAVDDLDTSQRAHKRVARESYSYPVNIAIVNKGSLDVIKLLAEEGKDVLTEKDGPNMAGTLGIAIGQEADEAILDMLLSINPECAKVCDRQENLPLHSAVRAGNVSAGLINKIHSAYPEALSKRNMHGETPVDVAVRSAFVSEDLLDHLQHLAYGSHEATSFHLVDDVDELSVSDHALSNAALLPDF